MIQMQYLTQPLISSIQNTAVIIFCMLCIIDLVNPVFLPFPTEVGEEYEFDLQVQVPYSIILPGFPEQKYRRSIHKGISSAKQRLMEAYKIPTPESEMASQVEAVFQYLDMREVPCQQTFVCMIIQNPMKYTPLSNALLQHLQPLYDQLKNGNVTYSSKMWRYIELYEAGNKGYWPGTNCSQQTAECSQHPDSVINWTTLKGIQSLMQVFKIKFN